MPDQAGPGGEGRPALRTLADKVNWLIEQAHPAGRGPLSNAEVCFMIHKVTGEEISVTTLWKLRNGQQKNPQLRVIQALATTFGVNPAFFFDDYDEEKLSAAARSGGTARPGPGCGHHQRRVPRAFGDGHRSPQDSRRPHPARRAHRGAGTGRRTGRNRR